MYCRFGVLIFCLLMFVSCASNSSQDSPKTMALYNKAVVTYLGGNLPQAEKEFSAMVKSYPDYIPAYLMLGKTCFFQNRMSDARKWFLKARARHPNVMSYVWLGKIDLLLKHPEEALKNFNQALKLDESSPLTHFEMGKYYRMVKNYEKAIYHLNYAISYEGMYTEMREELMALYREIGLPEKAAEVGNVLLDSPYLSEGRKNEIKTELGR